MSCFCTGEVRWQQPQPSGLHSTLPVLSVPDLDEDKIVDVALVASDNTQVHIYTFFMHYYLHLFPCFIYFLTVLEISLDVNIWVSKYFWKFNPITDWCSRNQICIQMSSVGKMMCSCIRCADAGGVPLREDGRTDRFHCGSRLLGDGQSSPPTHNSRFPLCATTKRFAPEHHNHNRLWQMCSQTGLQ